MLHLDKVACNLQGSKYGIYLLASTRTCFGSIPILQIDTCSVLKLEVGVFKDPTYQPSWTYSASLLLPISYTVDTTSFNEILSLFRSPFVSRSSRLGVIVLDHSDRSLSGIFTRCFLYLYGDVFWKLVQGKLILHSI